MRKITNQELNRPTLAEFAAMGRIPVVVVLDNVRSAQNVGAFFRTADAFAIERLALCGITPTPPSKDIHKTALGAEASVDWKYFENTTDCIEYLKAEGYKVYAVEQADESVSLQNFDIAQHHKIAIILGNEVDGVDDEAIKMSDGCIEIPQYGTKHSLNVSIATGIVVWDIFTKLNKWYKI